MLTFLILIALYFGMGLVLESKGWKTRFWAQILVVVVWLGAEFLGGLGVGIFWKFYGTERETALAELLVVPFLCAVIGVGVLFFLVSRLPSRNPAGERLMSGGPSLPVTEYRCFGCTRYFTVEAGSKVGKCRLCGHEHIAQTEVI